MSAAGGSSSSPSRLLRSSSSASRQAPLQASHAMALLGLGLALAATTAHAWGSPFVPRSQVSECVTFVWCVPSCWDQLAVLAVALLLSLPSSSSVAARAAGRSDPLPNNTPTGPSPGGCTRHEPSGRGYACAVDRWRFRLCVFQTPPDLCPNRGRERGGVTPHKLGRRLD